MADYRKMYSKMYNSVTDAERLLQEATTKLRTAQQECEEMFVEADDTPIALADNSEKK